MNCYAASIKCSNACRRNDCGVFVGAFFDFSQQGCFACPRLTRQKNRLIGLIDKLFNKCGDIFGGACQGV